MRLSIAAKIMALVIASVVGTMAIIQLVASKSIRDGYEAFTGQAVQSYLNVFDRQVETYKENYLDQARAQPSAPMSSRGSATTIRRRCRRSARPF
jgi:methyl-accepting chemotaxis protein